MSQTFETDAFGRLRVAGTTQGLLGKDVLWHRRSASETGILTVAAERDGVNDAAVKAAITWDEIR